MQGIRGTVAAVKWAYYTAAAVNGYYVTRDPDTGAWSVSGSVVLTDPYKLAQRPLFFVAPHKGGAWRWEIHELTVIDNRLSARLGPLTTEGANGLTCA